MSDNKFSMAEDEVSVLKESATNFGFDGGVIADILNKFGPDVLTLMVEAARNGFNVEWVVSTLNRFGPNVFQFFVDLWGKNMAVAPVAMSIGELAVGEVQQGVVLNAEVIQTMDANFMTTLMDKYLPEMMDKFGPQFIDLLMDAIVKALNAPVPQNFGGGRVREAFLQGLFEKLLPIVIERYGPIIVQKLMTLLLSYLKTSLAESQK
jgi:hypothetical protein